MVFYLGWAQGFPRKNSCVPYFPLYLCTAVSRSVSKINQTDCSRKFDKNTIHPPLVFCTLESTIEVGGTPLKIDSSLLSIDKNGVGGTKLSTLDPYTVLHSSIYKALVDVITAKAKAMKIPRVDQECPPLTLSSMGKMRGGGYMVRI